MKIAVLADIHGNSLALEKVLEDIRANGGVDEYWFLGDYAAIGHDPTRVMEQISSLPEAHFIRGNTDRYISRGEVPGPTLSAAVKDPALLRQHLEAARSLAWTAGAVTAAGWLPWFMELKLDMRFTLPDGTRVLAVHASPGKDGGDGIDLNTSEEELARLISGVEADLLFVGHTHVEIDRIVGKIRVINPCSVSNPYPPDLRAGYGLLEADGDGYRYIQRRVDYDRDAVVRAVKQVKHPAADYIIRFMRGENQKPWMKQESRDKA